MKRVSLLILTFIYLLSCSGIAVKRYYCCGILASVNVVYGAADIGEKSSPKKNKNCCQHEQRNFKLKDAHFNTSTLSIHYPLPAFLPQVNKAATVRLSKLFAAAVQHQNKAQQGPGIPIYTLYCDYRI